MPGEEVTVSFRPLLIADEAMLRAEIDGETVWQKKLRFVRPAEMISVTLPAGLLDERKVTFHLQNTEETK